MRGLSNRSLALVCGAMLLPLAGQAAESSAPVQATWKTQEIRYSYTGFTTAYDCDAAEDRLKAILRALGAHEQTRVSAQGCNLQSTVAQFLHHRSRPPHQCRSRSAKPTATANTSSEELLKRLGVASKQLDETFPAEWKTVELSRDRKLDLEPGDCELMEGLRDHVLPKLSVKIVGRPGRVHSAAGERSDAGVEGVRAGAGRNAGRGEAEELIPQSPHAGEGLVLADQPTSRINSCFCAADNSGPRPALRLSLWRSGLPVAGMTAVTASWLRQNFRNICAHELTPTSAAQPGNALPFTWLNNCAVVEVAIGEHRDAELLRHREQPLLRAAVGHRIIDLQEVRLGLLDHVGELVLRRVEVVGDAGVLHLALFFQFARHRNLRFPVAEIVHLEQLDLVGAQ